MFKALPAPKRGAAAAAVVLLALGLQCLELHAELVFRSVDQEGGQQRLSAIKKYGNPSDTGNASATSKGTPESAGEVRVFLTGDITRADVDSAGVMARLVKGGQHRLADNSIWLSSNGGDIDAAMQLGKLLRELGVFTLVGADDQCLSACVFVFMGGERRSVAGRLGIHRPYFPYTHDVPDRQLRFRHLQRTLKAYIEELDFPSSLYEAVMLVPPETMKILSPAELKRFFLEGISPSSEDLADAAAARRLNLSMFEYLKYKATAPTCDFLVSDPGRCIGQARQAATSGGALGRGTDEAQGSGAPRAKKLTPPG
ncbi:MAG: hypothetical protein ABI654_08755 [Betaproteobacteria bacterium]